MSRVRVRLALIAVAGLVAAALLGAAAAAALSAPTLTLTGPASVQTGDLATLSVTATSPATAGETITLEKLNGLTWSVVGTSALDSGLHATFTQTPTKAGKTQYRAKIAATGSHAAATSKTYTMTAVLATPVIALTGPAQVEIGTEGVMTAAVTHPASPGETVTLQKSGALGWSSAGSTTLDASSHGTFPVTPAAVGTTQYRVTIAKTATHLAATSNTYALNAVPLSCGASVLKADGTPWVCTFRDEFNGTTLDRNAWVPYRTSQPGILVTGDYPTIYTCYDDRSDVVAEHDGVLELSLRELAAPASCGSAIAPSKYVAGMVYAKSFSQTYGRFEVKAKVPSVRDRGLQETFWLWPVDQNKYGTGGGASGEIDFAEFYSRYPDEVKPYVHYVSNEAVDDPDHTARCAINYGEFNTYALEWYPGQLKIYVNDVLCMTSNYHATNVPADHPYAPFDSPFFPILTQAMGLSNPYDPADNHYDTNVVPDVVSTQIDYVHIWK
jgi:beta-glucanase (GH16 family)